MIAEPRKHFALAACLLCLIATAAPATARQQPGVKKKAAAPARDGGRAAPSVVAARPLVISEFRLQGPNGANDEFVEIYNASDADHTVAATSGSGYGVAASDGALRFTIPTGTLIPARGHYLGCNSTSYSQSNYPAGNGTTATCDATYTQNIENAEDADGPGGNPPAPRRGISLFSTSVPADFNTNTRLDAVGPVEEANALYKEGGGYPNLNNFTTDHAVLRKLKTGVPQDTDNNDADFSAVDTNGTNMCTSTPNFECQRLGAPGPEGVTASSPINRGTTAVKPSLIDQCVSNAAEPNAARVPCPCSGAGCLCASQNATFGTFSIRRRFTNNTPAAVSRLRFRIVDITTFPSISGTADLRAITSASAVTPNAPFTVNVSAQCGGGTRTIEATTLETGGTGQPNGGGYNSTLSAGSVTLATQLAPGASVDLQFLFGVQQAGAYRFFVIIEVLP